VKTLFVKQKSSALFQVSQQTFWQLLGKAITSLATFIILGMVTRAYGEAQTGVFTLALTYLAFFYLISDFGINAHIVPHLLHGPISAQWRRLLGLRITLSLILFTIAATGVLIWPVDNLFRQAVLWGSLAIFGSSVYTTAAAIFQSKLRYDLSTLAVLVGTLVPLPLFYLFIASHQGIPYLMLVHLLGWLLLGATALISVKRYISSLLPVFDFSYIKKIILEVWPITATLILNTIYFRLDAFILSSLKSFSEVGVYNLSFSIFQSLLVVPTFIMNGYYPVMIKNFSQDKQKFVANLKKAAVLMLAVAALGTVFTLLLSPLVVNVLTGGQGFMGAEISLQILSLSFPAFFVSSILMWTLVTIKKYKTMMIIYFLGLIFNLVLNLVFIPKYSFYAASAVTVMGEYLIVLLQVVVLIRVLAKQRTSFF